MHVSYQKQLGSASYQQGSSVTLTESPSTGASFTGWGGACITPGRSVAVHRAAELRPDRGRVVLGRRATPAASAASTTTSASAAAAAAASAPAGIEPG